MATEVRSYRTAAGISREMNFHIDTLAETGPAGGPVLRLTCDDSDTGGAGSGLPNERNDGQIGSVPLQSVRTNRCYMRIIAIPSNAPQGWLVPGPFEIHGITLDQAPVMPCVVRKADGFYYGIDANAGRGPHRYFAPHKIVLNEWFALSFSIFYTNDRTGWWRFEIDGQVVAQVADEATTAESRSGYWKYANYRDARNTGAMTYDTSAGHILDGDTGVGVWTLPGEQPPPPPPPPVNERPAIVVHSPPVGSVLHVGDPVQVTYTVTDDTAVARAWIGYVGAAGNVFVAPTDLERDVETTVELPAPVAGDLAAGLVHFYAAAEDDQGLAATPAAYDLTVSGAIPPPPGPPPDDPCAPVQAELETTRVELAAALTRAVGAEQKIEAARAALT